MNRIVRTTRALALASLVALLATAVAQGMNHGAGHAHGAINSYGTSVAPAGMGMGTPNGMGSPMATQTIDEASFLVHMILHHREAVASAETLRAVTQRPELLELADAIITSQSAEITAMEGWLDEWHPDVDLEVAYTPMMRALGPDAAVADVERVFLEDMIGHHMMAVHDAQALLAGGQAEHDEVAALARSIVNDQVGEIQRMAVWLRSWFDVAEQMRMGAMGMGMGTTGMRDHGVGGPGMGATGMGAPGTGATGMGAMGMGHYGMAAGGSMADMHEAMHGSRSATTIGAAEAERLALAFLAGRGESADVAALLSTTVVYEVVVQMGDAEQVLRIDARSGEVTLAPER